MTRYKVWGYIVIIEAIGYNNNERLSSSDDWWGDTVMGGVRHNQTKPWNVHRKSGWLTMVHMVNSVYTKMARNTHKLSE